jgi:MerR family transcriptional regulator, copper efflux regulator
MLNHDQRIRSLEDCVRVSEAAVILGVSTKTLRNWDRLGKVKARRHPVNGYRIYMRVELEALLNQNAQIERDA